MTSLDSTINLGPYWAFISGDDDASLEREARAERDREHDRLRHTDERGPVRVPDRGGLTTEEGRQLEREQIARDRAARRVRCISS